MSEEEARRMQVSFHGTVTSKNYNRESQKNSAIPSQCMSPSNSWEISIKVVGAKCRRVTQDLWELSIKVVGAKRKANWIHT